MARGNPGEYPETLIRRPSLYDPVPEPPDTLYHATTDLQAVVREGLKPRSELERAALGGGAPIAVSLTGSMEIACEIARALYEITLVSQGEVEWGELIRWAKRDGVYRDIVKFVFIEHERFRRLVEDGLKQVTVTLPKPLPAGAVADPESPPLVGRDGVERYFRWFEPVTEEEDLEWRFEFYRKYLAFADHRKERYDPLFFGVSIGDFVGLDPYNIGIVEVEVTDFHPVETEPYRKRDIVPGSYAYKQSMDEFRFFDPSVLEVTGTIRSCDLEAHMRVQ